MSEKIDIKNKLAYVDKYIAENSCDDLVVEYFVDILNYIYELENKFSKQRNLYKEIQTDIINSQQRIDNALKIAFEYSQIDGSHHKAWVIDQMIRSLLGDDYKKWVEKYMFDGQDPIEAVQNENYFKWDVGVAP